MSLSIAGIDFGDVTEITDSNDQFYIDALNYYKVLFYAQNGFDLYFSEESKVDMESFTEKNFYENKTIRIKKCFDLMHESMDYHSHKSFIVRGREKITEILNKEILSEAEINEVRTCLERFELQRDFVSQLERMNAFIKDALNHLPPMQLEIRITAHYKIHKGNVEKISEEPYIKKRTIVGNNLFLSDSRNNHRLVYFGHLPFRLCGRGSCDVWELQNDQWGISNSRQTWIS